MRLYILMIEYILYNDHFDSKTPLRYALSVSLLWPVCLCWLASPNGGARCPTDHGVMDAYDGYPPCCAGCLARLLLRSARVTCLWKRAETTLQDSSRPVMQRVETFSPGQSTLPERILGAIPPSGTTTLYDVIAALQEVVEPGEDAFVVAIVDAWLRSGRLRFVDDVTIAA